MLQRVPLQEWIFAPVIFIQGECTVEIWKITCAVRGRVTLCKNHSFQLFHELLNDYL